MCRSSRRRPRFAEINPSGYSESQGAFALRLARELGPRLGVATPINFDEQTEFPEPAVRINTDLSPLAALGWDESAARDGIASYYRGIGDAADSGGRQARSK
jgi:UDP-glucose 4-epimerase